MAWELIYGVFYPPGLVETIAFLPWVFIDLVLVYATLKFGPREWKQAPLVAQNLPAVIAIGCAMSLAAHGTFVQLFEDPGVACFWAGYACQVIVSWSALSQLLSRGSTRGHSMRIWYVRHSCRRLQIFMSFQVVSLVGDAGCDWCFAMAILPLPGRLCVCGHAICHISFCCACVGRSGVPLRLQAFERAGGEKKSLASTDWSELAVATNSTPPYFPDTAPLAGE